MLATEITETTVKTTNDEVNNKCTSNFQISLWDLCVLGG